MNHTNIVSIIESSDLFDEEFYLCNNQDVKDSGFSASEHYAEHGWKEGRDPSKLFSTNGYMLINPDVTEMNINPLFYHETVGRDKCRQIISVDEFCKNNTDQQLADKQYKIPADYYKDTFHKNEDIYYSQCYNLNRQTTIAKTTTKLNIAFFTCIANNYDTLKQVFVKIENAKYYAFSDTTIPLVDPWSVMPCLYNHKDPTRTARFIKTHPHLYFEDLDIAIWIDSNVIIKGDLTQVIENFYASHKTVGCIAHPLRRSVYDEYTACKLANKDTQATMDDFIEKIKFEGFKDEDLFETNVLMYNMKDKNLKNFLTKWWECIDSFSKRDQLSFIYSINKSMASYSYILNRDFSVRNSELFLYAYHDGEVIKSQDDLLLDSEAINPYSGKYYYNCRDNYNNIERSNISIIICVYNAYETTQKCLDSILKTTFDNIKIVLVNDASTDIRIKGLLNKFSKRKNVKLISNKINVGYVKSINRGLAISKSDFVILLNSDTITTRGWVEKLYDAAFSSTNIGIVGPLSNSASFQSLPTFVSHDGANTAINKIPDGLTPEDINLACEKWSIVNHYPIWPLVHGFCMGIKRSVLDSIGGFDEDKFGKGYGEENDFCLRAWNAGFIGAIATNTFIYHEKSQSFDNLEERLKLMNHGGTIFKTNLTSHKYENLISAMKHNKIVQSLRTKTSKMFLSCTESTNLVKRLFVIPSVSFSDENEDIPTGSAYVRLIYPFERLEMSKFNISVFMSKKAPHTLPSRDKFDIIVIQREGIGIDINEFTSWALEWKHSYGKIIYDIDDDLEIISEEYKHRIETFVRLADIVIVSTEQLKNKFSIINEHIVLINNKLDETLWNFDKSFNEIQNLKAERQDNKLHIGYIGTPSHFEEVISLEQQISVLNLEFNSNIQFDVIGAFQRECPSFANKIALPKKSSYTNFANWLFIVSNFDVVVLPLADTALNNSKSNLKFLEYAALGLPIVCTSHHAYSGIAQNFVNCIIENNDTLINGVRRLLSDLYLRRRLAITARAQIIENYGLFSNLRLYYNVINQL